MIQDREGDCLSAIIVHVDHNLQELIPEFLERRYEDVRLIAGALATKDSETIESIAHNMRGIGGMYGFNEITEIGRELQEARFDGNFPKVEKLLKQLEIYLSSIEIVYDLD